MGLTEGQAKALAWERKDRLASGADHSGGFCPDHQRLPRRGKHKRVVRLLSVLSFLLVSRSRIDRKRRQGLRASGRSDNFHFNVAVYRARDLTIFRFRWIGGDLQTIGMECAYILTYRPSIYRNRSVRGKAPSLNPFWILTQLDLSRPWALMEARK